MIMQRHGGFVIACHRLACAHIATCYERSTDRALSETVDWSAFRAASQSAEGVFQRPWYCLAAKGTLVTGRRTAGATMDTTYKSCWNFLKIVLEASLRTAQSRARAAVPAASGTAAAAAEAAAGECVHAGSRGGGASEVSLPPVAPFRFTQPGLLAGGPLLFLMTPLPLSVPESGI